VIDYNTKIVQDPVRSWTI